MNHSDQITIKYHAENFRRGFLTNILNTKAILFEAVFLPQFANPALGSIGLQIFTLGTLLAGCGLIWNLLLAYASGNIASLLMKNSRVQSFQKWLLSIVYFGLALRLVTTKRSS